MIALALKELTKKKSLEKITVKDIVDTCGISRQTFYYHFQDILDVIEWFTYQALHYLTDEVLLLKTPEQGDSVDCFFLFSK